MRAAAVRLASLAILSAGFLGLRPISIAPSDRLLPEDDVKVRAVEAAYAAAWVKNDPAAVLATLWPDAVLMPPGRAPVRGLEEIRRFWWPPGGPRTTVTVFDSLAAALGATPSRIR